MGAKRLPREIRARVLKIVEEGIPIFTIPTGEREGQINVESLAQWTLVVIERDPALRVSLMRAATELAVDSTISDLFRDKKIAGRVGGKKSRIREIYRVPQSDGKWITKRLGDLTPEDIDAIEQRKHAEALHDLADCKALRVLRGFAGDDTTAQIELELGEAIS